MAAFQNVLVRDSTLELLTQQRRPIPQPAANLAPMLLEYAVLAARAYPQEQLDRKTAGTAPLPEITGWVEIDDAPTELLSHTHRVGVGRVTCRVFRSSQREREEIVLAFPGMDMRKWADWWAALRWVTRHVPALDDKFRQVRANTRGLIDWLRLRHGANFRLIAVGHSLGGGLAQQAAYATGGFDEVLAFNPTFVTGWYETATEAERRANAQGLHIFRIYEDGEIFAFLWHMVEWFYPLARKPNPRITRIRTHFYSGFAPLQKHKIVEMSNSLQALASLRNTTAKSSLHLRAHIEQVLGAHLPESQTQVEPTVKADDRSQNAG
jgi:hypothetical protein